MAYSSKVDIKLAQQPKSSHAETYEDRLDLYNAVHILNARLEGIQNGLTSGEDDVPPWEALPFTRWFWATAWEDIAAGKIVTIVRGTYRNEDNSASVQVEGMVMGAPYPAGINFSVSTESGTGIDSIGTGAVGVSLDEVKAGERGRFGIGPAVIQVPGIKRGDLILSPEFALDPLTVFGNPIMQSVNYRGAILRTWVTQIPSLVVGSGIDTDAALIFPMVDYYSQLKARAGLDRSSIPPGPVSEG